MRRQEVQMQFQIHTLYTHKLVYLWKRFFKHYFIDQKQIHSLHFKKFWKTNPPTTHTQKNTNHRRVYMELCVKLGGGEKAGC